jgi:hypothetical protein
MPVHRQKKDTTPNTPGSTQEQTAPGLPEQQTFQQYLRELARCALVSYIPFHSIRDGIR